MPFPCLNGQVPYSGDYTAGNLPFLSSLGDFAVRYRGGNGNNRAGDCSAGGCDVYLLNSFTLRCLGCSKRWDLPLELSRMLCRRLVVLSKWGN